MKRKFREHMTPTEQPSYARRTWHRGRLLVFASFIGALSLGIRGGCMPMLPAPADAMQSDGGTDAMLDADS